VPVPATVLDAHGVAVTNLKLEDFELTVDGQTKPISEITRTESPVRLAMLFDNSGRWTLPEISKSGRLFASFTTSCDRWIRRPSIRFQPISYWPNR
jgi:hypothetical protein